MNEIKYLVDNNALIALGTSRVGSDFFRSSCHVTPDVLFEANEHPEERRLSEVVIEFTAATFEHMRQLMLSVPPGDIGLLDLYRNKGAADPGLIAWIQEMAVSNDGMLFADQWVLVTNDIAVRELAAREDISSIGSSQLAEMIDENAA